MHTYTHTHTHTHTYTHTYTLMYINFTDKSNFKKAGAQQPSAGKTWFINNNLITT